MRIGVALCLAVMVLPALSPPSGADSNGITPLYRITTDSAGPDKTFEAFDAVTIAAFDLDGDGVKEIITHNDNSNVYVFNGKTGALIAELETTHPSDWGAREIAGISVGDVNGNGLPDLVMSNSAGYVTVFEARPHAEKKIEFVKLWERFMDPHEEDPDYVENHPWVEWDGFPGLDGSVFLADATGDGRDELFLQLDDTPGLYAMTGDGVVYGWKSWSDGNANPIAADLTGDGKIEVAYPSDGGRIFVFDAKTFAYRCQFNARDHGAMPASISVAPTAVDLTGDGKKELVFGVRQAVEDPDDPEWYLKMHAHYFAMRSDCTVLWHKTWNWGNPHIHMHPIPLDVDGDGNLDVLFQDWNTIGHKPGDWQVTGKPNLFAVKGATGELIWQVETSTFWSNKNLAVADVNVDGAMEILLIAEEGGQEGIMLYGLDGKKKGFVPAPPGWLVSRGPAVLDLTGDGRMEIVLSIMRASEHCTRDLDVGCREGALQVYRTEGSGAPVWPNMKRYNAALDQTFSAATTGGGGGGDGSPDPERAGPVIRFADGFPPPGSALHPEAEIMVQVTGGSPVVSVEMRMGVRDLVVDFDGVKAINVPGAPLPLGSQVLSVRALDTAGLEAVAERPLVVALDGWRPGDPAPVAADDDTTAASAPPAGPWLPLLVVVACIVWARRATKRVPAVARRRADQDASARSRASAPP